MQDQPNTDRPAELAEPLEYLEPVDLLEVDGPPDGAGTACAAEEDGVEVLGPDDDFDTSDGPVA